MSESPCIVYLLPFVAAGGAIGSDTAGLTSVEHAVFVVMCKIFLLPEFGV